MTYHIKKLKKGDYGIFSSKKASLDCVPQYTAPNRDSAELIKMRLIKEKGECKRVGRL